MFGFARKKYELKEVDGLFAVVFKEATINTLLAEMSKDGLFRGISDKFHDMYRVYKNIPDISDFRVGQNYFESVPLDWIILCSREDNGKSRLIGHGVMARIRWNGSLETLPRGWADSVVQARIVADKAIGDADTMVGLFINVERDQKKSGAAEKIITLMKEVTGSLVMRDLIIPLRPPVRYQRAYVELDFEEFSSLVREDGQPLDYWVRVHVKVGAKVIAVNRYSHQHAIPKGYVANFFEISEALQNGDLILKKGDEFYYGNMVSEHDMVVVNQGCVWVSHFH